MFNKILLIGPNTMLGEFLKRSLIIEGYEVAAVASPAAARKQWTEFSPDLILINSIHQPRLQIAGEDWPVPVILLAKENPTAPKDTWFVLSAPFAFQDVLLLIQDALYQRTLHGRQIFQLSAELLDQIENILETLRQDLRSRCVILSSSSGRLIKTAGAVEQGPAISLAALMSAGFSATAQAAQILGHGEMFDSNLQESEGHGLYAIRLHDKLVLSVSFSARITVGMVRHYTAQAAVDILELLAREAQQDSPTENITLDADFRNSVNQVLGDILRD